MTVKNNKGRLSMLIVLNEMFNNQGPNFMQPILISIIKEKIYMKIIDTGGYLTFLGNILLK